MYKNWEFSSHNLYVTYTFGIRVTYMSWFSAEESLFSTRENTNEEEEIISFLLPCLYSSVVDVKIISYISTVTVNVDDGFNRE